MSEGVRYQNRPCPTQCSGLEGMQRPQGRGVSGAAPLSKMQTNKTSDWGKTSVWEVATEGWEKEN